MEALLVPVIEKLTDLLIEEVKSLKGVHGEVESLKEELEIILLLLKDAEAKSEKGETSHAVKAWVNQIRVQADRIEDLVDNYRYHLIKLQNEKGLTGYVRRVKYMKPRRKIASEIETIKRSLHAIKGRGKGYGLRPPDRTGSSRGFASEERVDPRLESLFVEEEEVVGIESLKDEVIAKLVKGPLELLVISLVGQGGVGKTTLAKKVIDDGAVMRHFESVRAWVTVSQPYDLKKILVSLMVKLQVGSREEADGVEDLIGRLRIHLRTRRYAIVFDDVWEERFWDEIKLALPPNNEGSRIMITTRNSSIANHCKNSPNDIVQQIRPWPQKPAFELFCKKAFGAEFPSGCPDELMESSMEIVSKCQGLPLVIAAIAGLLRTKEKTVFEWEKVLHHLDSKVEISSELTRVHKILSLSYHDLPHILRPCFTYICLFPEDYSIANERLYRLWTAEGFVKAKGGRTPEEVAEEYMAELVRRNLVSLDQFKVIIGQGNFFRVHDLMRNVILLRVKELSFCQIWDEKALKFRGNGRRLMISGNARKALEIVETSSVRSLFLSHTSDDQLTDSFLATLFQKFKLLEVLDFERSRIETLPKELGKMLCLKYLSLWKTNVKSLPKSIGKLRNLYSLDIRDTSILELPKEINKLKNLQHVLAYRENRNHKASLDSLIGVRLHEGFGANLKALQTLVSVEAHPGGGAALTRELENLGALRWLEVVRLTADLTTALCPVIEKLNRLERLTLISVSEDEPLPLQHVSTPPLGLRDMALAGWLDRLPRWISELRNLRLLALTSFRLTESPVEALKGFPSLETLYLGRNAYEGEELHFKEGGFRGLKALILYKMVNLKAVKIDDGALIVLHQLEIYDCPALQEVSSLRHMTNLNYATANGKLII